MCVKKPGNTVNMLQISVPGHDSKTKIGSRANILRGNIKKKKLCLPKP